MTLPYLRSFALLGATLGVETDDPDVDAVTSELWQPFVTDDTPAEGDAVAIRREGGGWALRGFRGHEASSRDPWEIAEQACSALFQESIRRATDVVDLHAGVVMKQGLTVLLVAGTGTGKTTLTLELAAAGWGYVSDDLAPIDRDTTLVHAFPKPVSVKDAGRFEELVTRTLPGWPGPERAFPARLDAAAAPAERLRADVVVFLERDGDPPALTPVGSSEATLRCGRFVSREKMTADGLHVLATLCTAARTFELRYGEARAAAEAVTRVADEIPKVR